MNELYLHPSYFVDADHPAITTYAFEKTKNCNNDTEKAIALYYAIRDDIRYNPYNISLQHKDMKASVILQREQRQGYCIEKSCVYNACLRAVGIPSRFHFFDVKNHIGVEKLIEILKTDVLVFHACSEVYLNGNWVKATPAFNKALCEHIGVTPLEFDGIHDSIFQEYDKSGGQFMDYLVDYGVFHDVPHDMFVMLLKKYYPHFFTYQSNKSMIK